ncbi:hypothetical protein C8J56DRAFT_899659 [Mycena floridula]|nr:hypothetical protein C8J56DRAFT_899650 [Mycena floridula]KAJ7576547.1 hypothetical protein C8J56DRAFT_899659 [Mycena floridula]
MAPQKIAKGDYLQMQQNLLEVSDGRPQRSSKIGNYNTMLKGTSGHFNDDRLIELMMLGMHPTPHKEVVDKEISVRILGVAQTSDAGSGNLQGPQPLIGGAQNGEGIDRDQWIVLGDGEVMKNKATSSRFEALDQSLSPSRKHIHVRLSKCGDRGHPDGGKYESTPVEQPVSNEYQHKCRKKVPERTAHFNSQDSGDETVLSIRIAVG